MGALDDITWNTLNDDLWLKAKRDRIPITGFFELTPLCNFRCRMCYVRLDNSELSKFGRIHSGDEWVSVASQAAQMGTLAITLTGGEPLTHPDFDQIYTELSRMGLIVSLLTNGSPISDRHIKLFSDYPPARIRITLYGASNETYGRLCNAPNGFDTVMNAVKRIKGAGIPLAFSFTETLENVSDFDAVMKIAHDFDVPIVVASDINSAVRGAKSDADSLRVPLEDRRMPSEDLLREAQTETDVINTAAADGLLSGAFARCRIYRTAFFINWNGTMENCASMSWCRSRPFDVGFTAAWNDMQDKLAHVKLPEKCAECADARFCSACPGMRNAETDSPEGIAERHCSEAQRRHAIWVKRHQRGGENNEEVLSDS